MRVTITVDDDDRDQCPDDPWTATAHDESGSLVGAGEAGTGRTPREAVADCLARNAEDLPDTISGMLS